MGTASLLSEADRHGLVDGHIEPDRRAEVLRRAAASPRDRALIEAWQDQNDLIRTAFAGVDREPVPRTLDLRTPPRLHAVPPILPMAETPSAKAPSETTPARRRRGGAGAATMLAIAAGLAGSWYVAGLPTDDVRTPASRAPGEERMLADRTIAALAFGEPDAAPVALHAEPPPTTIIPDLSGAGFTFAAAEARGTSPKTLIFRYRNTAGERVAIGATRTEGADSRPMPRDGGFIWRTRRVAYAIFGTLPPDRLDAAARSLAAEGKLE